MKLGLIARLLEARLVGDPDMEIHAAMGINDAKAGEITFAVGAKNIEAAKKSSASCVILKDEQPDFGPAQLIADDPQFAFAKVLSVMHPRPAMEPGISGHAFIHGGASIADSASVGHFAVVSKGASIGENTVVMPGVFIGENSRIGRDCLIYPNVSLMDGTLIGDRVIIHAGAVIGADGFGYMQKDGMHAKIPQVGGVLIGDDVEIGACSAIDRATTGMTVIGKGTKIDNLVQIAHNVKIGEHCIIVAQAGIAGSSKLGKYVVMGGQSALADHTEIADGTMLGGRAGAFGKVKKGVYSGAPLMPHTEWLRASVLFSRLPELNGRIGELEKKIKELQDKKEGEERGQK